MISASTDWDEDLPADPEEEYQTFVRTLERTEGFRLFFVRCTPAESERLIGRVKQDLPQKKIEVLQLNKPIDTLYDQVESLTRNKPIDILFIQGLEHSFYEYEIEKFGEASERYFYNWTGVPRILNHLNQQRERFRDDFKICLVFILRQFGIKYFIRRSPDFFDWRSGVFEFPTEREIVEKESSRILAEGDYQKYLTLTPQEQRQKIVQIQERLQENHQIPEYKAYLLLELGNLCQAAKEYKEAVASYDQAVKIKPDLHEAWNNRGNALSSLGLYEEAIASYDQAVKIKPDLHEAWNNRGVALGNLGRYEEAIASYDQVVARIALKQEFETYLAENVGEEARDCLRLYLRGLSQEAIAKQMNKPIHQVYRLREKVSYHAVRVFALKTQPELVATWLQTSLQSNNLGLTPKQSQQFWETLTPQQRQLLEKLKAGCTIEAIAKDLGLKTHQVMGEWANQYHSCWRKVA